MKKSFILLSILFSISAFATDYFLNTGTSGVKYSATYENDGFQPYGYCYSSAVGGVPVDPNREIEYGFYNGTSYKIMIGYYKIEGSCHKYYRYTHMATGSCLSGETPNSLGVCSAPVVPPLSTYDNDSVGCSKAGGTFMSVGTEQFGGTSYGASFFGGKGIVLGGDIKSVTKCASTAEAVGDVIIQATALIPLASTLIKSQLLKRLTNKNWINILDKYMKPDGGYDFTPVTGKPQNFPDTYVGLPKLPSPSQVQAGPSTAFVREMFDRGISESPVPSTSTPDGNFPSRSPNITVAPEYQHIPDAIIPVNPTTNEPYIDYSTVDGGNTFIKTTPPLSSTAPKPKLADIVPTIGTTQKPVKETIDLSPYMPDNYSPSPTIATVPQTTTKSVTYSGSDPIDNFVTDISYPDNSSSRQTVRVNPRTGQGDISITTLSPDGVPFTISKPFQTTNYPLNGVPYSSIPPEVTISPSPSSISNPEGTTNPPKIEDSITNTAPTNNTTTNSDTVSNQSSDAIINATMPNYSLPNTPEFIPFDSNPITQMIDSASQMFSNIEQQIASTKTVFDNTKLMLEGGWTPPTIPAGSCGDSMAFDFHGRHIDLCPPLANSTAVASPIVSSVVTIGGMAFAVSIFFGGF